MESEALEASRRLEDRLLESLPGTGEAVGNTYLRRQLNATEDVYWSIRDSLVARGIVGVGRGRGGSTFKVVIEEPSPEDSHNDSEASLGSAEVPPDVANTDARGVTKALALSGSFRPLIETIEVRNFKRIDSVSIDLAAITILVGGNNAGKSSFLQAVHTAISCAQESQLQGQKVVSEANLRFSPTHDFSLLGHGGPYENGRAGSRGAVKFKGRSSTDHEREVDYTIEMYKGANHKNVGVDRRGVSSGFGSVISDPTNLFSVYVPGLSGILLQEETHGYASLFMRAARGDANLVFRNIIERLVRDNKQLKLEGYLTEVFGYPVRLRLDSHTDTDLYVDVRMAEGEGPKDHEYLPVELWGMGVLQVTQLLAYALLFEPDILLVDEPDSHVHPSSQKTLMVALERIAAELGCRVIISTHSRHVVTAAPDGAAIVWMKNGAIFDQVDRSVIPLLIDLGALDQFDMDADVLMATEDEDTSMLQSVVLGASGARRIELVSFNGINNATNAQAFNSICKLVKHAPTVAIHRDRDFFTDEELKRWARPYTENGIQVFCPRYCDMENYFATASHLSQVTGMSFEEAEAFRSRVVNKNLDVLRKKFEAKRKDANVKLWPDGGSPTNDSLWRVGDPPPEEFLYGKELLRLLKNELKRDPNYKSATALEKVASAELMEVLRIFLEGLD